MPMPALNIIAIHEIVLNSGSSPLRDSGIRPYRPNARTREKITKLVADKMMNQPRFVVTQLSALPDTVSVLSFQMPPMLQMRAMIPNAQRKTVLSIVAHPPLTSSAEGGGPWSPPSGSSETGGSKSACLDGLVSAVIVHALQGRSSSWYSLTGSAAHG